MAGSMWVCMGALSLRGEDFSGYTPPPTLIAQSLQEMGLRGGLQVRNLCGPGIAPPLGRRVLSSEV